MVTARGTGPRTEGASTIVFKTFVGGFLKLAGSLSASELSQLAARDVFITELDRLSTETENREGSPLHLAKLRQRTYEYTSKLVLECCPTIAGESRIEQEYKAGTQEHYYLPCPICGHKQELRKENFDWEVATYRCERCAGVRAQRDWLSRVGSWIPCIPPSNGAATVRSFWAPAWISGIGVVEIDRSRLTLPGIYCQSRFDDPFRLPFS